MNLILFLLHSQWRACAVLNSTYIAYSFGVDEDVPRHERAHAVQNQRQVEQVPAVQGRILRQGV